MCHLNGYFISLRSTRRVVFNYLSDRESSQVSKRSVKRLYTGKIAVEDTLVTVKHVKIRSAMIYFSFMFILLK